MRRARARTDMHILSIANSLNGFIDGMSIRSMFIAGAPAARRCYMPSGVDGVLIYGPVNVYARHLMSSARARTERLLNSGNL